MQTHHDLVGLALIIYATLLALLAWVVHMIRVLPGSFRRR